MKEQKIKAAGIEGKLIRATDIHDVIDPGELDSIYKYGKVFDGIYYRVRGGVLVLVCIGKSALFEIEAIVKMLAQKVKDQKRRHISTLSVFTYGV